MTRRKRIVSRLAFEWNYVYSEDNSAAFSEQEVRQHK